MKPFRIVLLICASLLLLAGCESGDPGAPSESSLLQAEREKAEYEKGMGRIAGMMDDPTQPNFQYLVDHGARQGLYLASVRWDRATDVAEGLKPPADIKADHAAMVKAMKQLGVWNRRIAKAAPDRTLTKKLSSQARHSAAAKNFGRALARMEQKGYTVRGGGSTPLDSAGTP